MQLDYPDAYSGKYGRRVLYSNSPKSDPILVLVGIFMFVSVIVVAFQYNRHSNAVSFICIAAEASLPPNRGGWPVGVRPFQFCACLTPRHNILKSCMKFSSAPNYVA